MKKYLFTFLFLLVLSGCGPTRRAVKIQSSSRTRDRNRIEQTRLNFTNSVKTVSDNSRIRIIYFRRDSVTGEQLIDREEVYENNIVSKDSTSKKEEENTNVAADSEKEEEVKEVVEEKRGLQTS